MPNQTIHTFGKGLVEGGLEIHAERFVPLIADGGHPFGRGERASIDMGRARALLNEEAVGIAGAMFARHGPVLGLRDGA